MKRGPIHRRMVPPQGMPSGGSVVKDPGAKDIERAAGSAASKLETDAVEDKLLRAQRIIEKIKAQQQQQQHREVKAAEERPRARVQSASSSSSSSSSLQETAAAKDVDVAEEEDEEEETRVAARRRALLERLRAKKNQGSVPATSSDGANEVAQSAEPKPNSSSEKSEAADAQVEEESHSSSSSSGNNEDESGEESDEEVEVLPMPTFVSKQVRKKEAEELERDELEREMNEERLREQRHLSALKAVDMALKEEALIQRRAGEKTDDSRFGLRPGRPDDTDGLDEEAEFAAWREREMRRLAREFSITV